MKKETAGLIYVLTCFSMIFIGLLINNISLSFVGVMLGICVPFIGTAIDMLYDNKEGKNEKGE